MNLTRVTIPTLVRIKPGALARCGVYLQRSGHGRVAVIHSSHLPPALQDPFDRGLEREAVEVNHRVDVADASFERAVDLFRDLPRDAAAIVGFGGGRALDVAKYVAFLAKRPYFSVPTSLSNDGFAGPQASLTIEGRRRSLPAAMPFGVIVDTAICRQAPLPLTLSGIGDLVAKATAIFDWKLAFHQTGEPLNDFAILLTAGAVQAFLSHPELDDEGLRTLANSLLLSGIAMEVCGSSRPASGSEHLISHALDEAAAAPRLHGLQVGVATYLISLVQGHRSAAIAHLFERTGFWQAIAAQPFSRAEWLHAIRRAPQVKPGFYTIFSTRNVMPELEAALHTDPWLQQCFVE